MGAIGRLLQILGLLLLPLAMLIELTGAMGPEFGLRDMLIMLVFGAAVFYVGWMLEGYAKRS